MQVIDQIAAFGVLVMGPSVFTQQVTHQLFAPWVVLQRTVELLGLFAQQVAARVESEAYSCPNTLRFLSYFRLA